MTRLRSSHPVACRTNLAHASARPESVNWWHALARSTNRDALRRIGMRPSRLAHIGRSGRHQRADRPDGSARLMSGEGPSAAPNGGSRAMSDQDRQHSVTDADLHRGALPNPGAVRRADHMDGRGQRRQALQSIRPGGVTLEGAGLGPAPCGRPRSRRPYRWTGEPRCLAPYQEPRAFPSAEASTWC
jgi:hypothetical protein